VTQLPFCKCQVLLLCIINNWIMIMHVVSTQRQPSWQEIVQPDAKWRGWKKLPRMVGWWKNFKNENSGEFVLYHPRNHQNIIWIAVIKNFFPLTYYHNQFLEVTLDFTTVFTLSISHEPHHFSLVITLSQASILSINPDVQY